MGKQTSEALFVDVRKHGQPEDTLEMIVISVTDKSMIEPIKKYLEDRPIIDGHHCIIDVSVFEP